MANNTVSRRAEELRQTNKYGPVRAVMAPVTEKKETAEGKDITEAPPSWTKKVNCKVCGQEQVIPPTAAGFKCWVCKTDQAV